MPEQVGKPTGTVRGIRPRADRLVVHEPDDRATSTGLGLTRMDIDPETAIGQQANDFLNDRTARIYPGWRPTLTGSALCKLGSMSADETGGQAGSSTSAESMSTRSLR